MRQANPRIVYVAITPFGQDGPYAEFAASDLTIAAMGGPMSLQGVASRAPVRLSVPQVWLHASSEAAVAALTVFLSTTLSISGLQATEDDRDNHGQH